MVLGRPLDPNAGRARLPFFRRLSLVSHGRIQLSGAHVDNDAVLICEFFLLFPLDMDIGPRHPAGSQVKVLLHAMPLRLVQEALGDGVQRRARLYGDVGDDQTLVVEREVVVDSLGQHAVPTVEKQDKEEDGEGEQAELDRRPNLWSLSAGLRVLSAGGRTCDSARRRHGAGGASAGKEGAVLTRLWRPSDDINRAP